MHIAMDFIPAHRIGRYYREIGVTREQKRERDREMEKRIEEK